jgi:hypothetical protein
LNGTPVAHEPVPVKSPIATAAGVQKLTWTNRQGRHNGTTVMVTVAQIGNTQFFNIIFSHLLRQFQESFKEVFKHPSGEQPDLTGFHI